MAEDGNEIDAGMLNPSDPPPNTRSSDPPPNTKSGIVSNAEEAPSDPPPNT
jgi:hypothetical protein